MARVAAALAVYMQLPTDPTDTYGYSCPQQSSSPTRPAAFIIAYMHM